MVIDGFDPENNAQDRRLLYEVTGMRLNLDEFRDNFSSGSNESEQEDNSHSHSYFDLENAFLYRGTGLESFAAKPKVDNRDSINP